MREDAMTQTEPFRCETCGNYTDTPMHEMGCEVGRRERITAVVDSIERAAVERAAPEQARDTGGLPWSNARYAKQPTHGVHTHEMDDRPCVEFVVGECALSQARDTGGLREAVETVIAAKASVPREYRELLDAALSKGAAHEERGLDVHVELLRAEWKGRLDGYDAAVGTLDPHRLLSAHLRVGISPSWDIEWARLVATEYARLTTPEAAPDCPECGGQYSDLPGHRSHAHGVTPEAAPEEGLSADDIGVLADARAIALADGPATPTPTTEEPNSIAGTPEDNR